MVCVRLVFGVVLVALSAACQRPADPAPQVAAQSSRAAGAPVISVEPASTPNCQPVVAEVTWDIRQDHPGVNEVQVYVVDGDQRKLFAEGGNHGSAVTGPWSRSGTTFVLLDKNGESELARATVGGSPCP